MIRSILASIALLLFLAGPASAQVVGWLTPQAGVIAGGDSGGSFAVGASVAAFEANTWLGAEMDFAHAFVFDEDRFEESGVTMLTVNAIAAPPRMRIQPYLLAGIGIMRLRAAYFEDVDAFRETIVAFDAGGGVQYHLNDVFAVRGDFRYLRSLEEDERLPRKKSGPFDFYRVTVGVSFSWAQM